MKGEFFMLNGTVGQVVKRSLLYGFVVSQPLAVYVDAYPVLNNKILLEADDLQYGEHGQMVRIVQQKMQTLSYYNDGIDSEFGVFTEYALKKFQYDRDIKVNGVVDTKVKTELIRAEKQAYLNQLNDLSEPVFPGMHGDNVKIVQEALQYFGYYEGNIDGIYGPLTRKGLEIAEKEHGIELTDEVTGEALEQLYHTEETTEEDSTDYLDDNGTDFVNEQDESGGTVGARNVETRTVINASVIDIAQSLIGTPYTWGGETPAGFDCSGFIQYVYENLGITIPRTVSDIWNFASPVEQPSVGDIVFFETYKPGPSHAGIYIGDNRFIHAGQTNGVEVSDLDMTYWQGRYLGAKSIQ